MQHFHVAAGILRNTGGQVLITERIEAGPYRDLWEFPGGKIHAGETALVALKRELLEEIGIKATTVEPFMNLTHEYPDRTVELEFFDVTEWSGVPTGLEGQQIRWVNISDLRANELLPADIAVIKELQNL
jgi:8-oxo-dGTP diphosphatase